MNIRRTAFGFLLLLASPTLAGHVWWQARDGSTAGYAEDASWADLQNAITSAQAGSSITGMVKISGDIMRTNSASGQLSVTNGGVITISGGWSWDLDSHAPTTQSGGSVLSANSVALASNIRVLYINGAPDVTLSNLDITLGRTSGGGNRGGGIYVAGASHRFVMDGVRVYDNRFSSPGYLEGGGGIAIRGSVALTGLRVSRCEITNNLTSGGSRGDGGGFFLGNCGTAASPMIIEYSTIKANTADARAGYDPGGGGIAMGDSAMSGGIVFLGNCRLVDNRSGNLGSAIYMYSGKVRMFGCLIAGNTNYAGSATSVLYVFASTATNAGNLANCTITEPASEAYFRTEPVFPIVPSHTVLINSIATLRHLSLPSNPASGYDSERTHMKLKHSTLAISTNRYQEGADYHWNETNTLAGAVTMQDDQGDYRFHSLTDANADANPALANELSESPQFSGTTGDYPYQLQPTDPSANSGVAVTSGAYTYVDLNVNGTYEAMVDVIVAGTAPAGSHLVYTTDLLGSPRIQGPAIDRGCYEATPTMSGTVFRFQ